MRRASLRRVAADARELLQGYAARAAGRLPERSREWVGLGAQVVLVLVAFVYVLATDDGVRGDE